MAKVVAVAGSKGGSGKSTCSHLLGHGAGSLPRMIQSVVITTDPEEIPRTDARRYVIVDGRSPVLLVAELERWVERDRLLIIIDGAAARPDLDRLVEEVADITIVPFRPGVQDAERAAMNLERLPKAVALPMGWSKHPGTVKRDKALLAMLPPGRLMPPFPHIPKLGHLLSESAYPGAAYELATPARNLLLETLAQGRIDPDDIAAPREAA